MKPLLALLPIAIGHAALAAQTDFSTAGSFLPLDTSPTDMISFDANADGRDDLILFFNSPNRFQIYYATPEGGFEPGPTTNLTGSVHRPVIADINGNQRQDLLIFSQSSLAVRVFLNTEEQGLVEPIWSPVPTITGARNITVADTNADGFPDILVVSNDAVAIHQNLGGGSGFNFPTQFPIPATNTNVIIAAADLRGDGTKEIAILNSANLAIYETAGQTYAFAQTINLGSNGLAIGVADVDLDSRSDLIIPVTNAARVGVVRYNPVQNAYTLFIPPTGRALNAASVTFGDVNGNSMPDIVYGFSGSGLTTVSYWDPVPTTFYRETQPPFGRYNDLRFPAILDHNGDGKKAIAYIGMNPPGIIIFEQGSQGGFAGNGATVDTDTTIRATRPYTTVFGTPALAVERTNFQPTTIFSIIPGFESFSIQSETRPTTNSSGRFLLADINGDGIDDFVFVASGSGPAIIRWQLGNADGSFGIPINRPVTDTTTIHHIVSADFNGDGIADIATLGINGTAFILFGQPSGFLSAPVAVQFSASSGFSSFITADLDLDGHADLIATQSQAGSGALNRMHIAYGRGDGTFEQPIVLPAAGNNGSTQNDVLAAGRINNSPYLDLAVAQGNNTVVYLSDGPRSYLPPLTVSSGSGIRSVQIADMNGDGRNEVITFFNSNAEIVGHGPQGLFSRRHRFYTPANPIGVMLADSNDNGIPDIYLANGSGFTFMPNRSTGDYCPIDFVPDGEINLFDLAAFIDAYNDADPVADLNWDGEFNFFDVARFLQLYQEGCP
ncbi:MAG: VCBS repeat-containing protein [Phycisphaerales bacterium]|nr:VCBS repeat-containing protein [Planctomycetota bacterium]MCH8509965.1 VCBS repeat-containing protein [Phycisphaerales bacterium]